MQFTVPGLVLATAVAPAFSCGHGPRPKPREGVRETRADFADIDSITAGAAHSCALRNGGAICWGSDRSGESSPPLSSFAALAAGGDFTCGLVEAGAESWFLHCWGALSLSEELAYSPRPSLSAGGGHVCAIAADGAVRCWGDNGRGQANPPRGAFDSVVSGEEHACALKPDHTASCWGSNNNGQLDAPALARFRELIAGEDFACGVSETSRLTCWGLHPLPSSEIDGIKIVAARGDTLCAGFLDGHVRCWASEGTYELNFVERGIQQIAVGDEHVCVRADDRRVSCFGYSPGAVVPGSPFTRVVQADASTCGLRKDGRVACWSLRPSGGLDPRLSEQPLTAERFTHLAGYTDFARNSSRFCALSTSGHIKCWPSQGQLSSMMTYARMGRFVEMAMSDGNICGVRRDRSLSCWNEDGRILLASSPGSVKRVVMGRKAACASDLDGNVTCWKMEGLKITNETRYRGPFVSFVIGGGAVRMEQERVAGDFFCGIRAGGKGYCVGATPSGLAKRSLKTVLSISSRQIGGDMCVLSRAGRITCYGSCPARPVGKFETVDVGVSATCGRLADDTLVCWTSGCSTSHGGSGWRPLVRIPSG